MGFNNPKPSGAIWLLAHHPGDAVYKSAVQQIFIQIPIQNTMGIKQQLYFNTLPNIQTSVKNLRLQAQSSSGLPVKFYVKSEPAYVSNDSTLQITKLPPKSRFPVKITVVAWQYGIADQIQSAFLVERSFYIEKSTRWKFHHSRKVKVDRLNFCFPALLYLNQWLY